MPGLIILLSISSIILPITMFSIVCMELSNMSKIIKEFTRIVDKNTEVIDELKQKLKGILYR